MELIVTDGLTAIVSAAQMVYPAARHQPCLAHWFRNLEALTPRSPWFQWHKFRRKFCWAWDADDQPQAAILCALAVGRTGDGGEIPIRVGRAAGVFRFPGAVEPPPAHDETGRAGSNISPVT